MAKTDSHDRLDMPQCGPPNLTLIGSPKFGLPRHGRADEGCVIVVSHNGDQHE